jgi:hypothetical protein
VALLGHPREIVRCHGVHRAPVPRPLGGGRLVPGFEIAFNAIGYERDTRALADRAIAFYGG